MRRRHVGTALAAIGAGALAACSSSGDVSTARRPVDDVSQPATPRPGPSEAPDSWERQVVGALALLLPADFDRPVEHEDWGHYTASWDQADDAGDVVNRIMVGSLGVLSSGAAAREITQRVNTALIKGYSEIGRISWENGPVAVDRLSFQWGASGAGAGSTWLVALDGGEVVGVTLIGTYPDDGLRNGIEESLAPSGEETA